MGVTGAVRRLPLRARKAPAAAAPPSAVRPSGRPGGTPRPCSFRLRRFRRGSRLAAARPVSGNGDVGRWRPPRCRHPLRRKKTATEIASRCRPVSGGHRQRRRVDSASPSSRCTPTASARSRIRVALALEAKGAPCVPAGRRVAAGTLTKTGSALALHLSPAARARRRHAGFEARLAERGVEPSARSAPLYSLGAASPGAWRPLRRA